MNELPDDLRALEAQLSQIKPASSLDTDRLIFESGYAAAIADQSTVPSARAALTIVGSALVGVAATLLVLFALRSQDPSLPPAAAVPAGSQRPTASSPTSRDREPARFAEKRTLPALASRQGSPLTDVVEVGIDSYSALRWRRRLIQSAGDGAVASDIPPDSFPSGGAESEPRTPLPTNLQWQRELLRDDSSREWVNS